MYESESKIYVSTIRHRIFYKMLYGFYEVQMGLILSKNQLLLGSLLSKVSHLVSREW